MKSGDSESKLREYAGFLENKESELVGDIGRLRRGLETCIIGSGAERSYSTNLMMRDNELEKFKAIKQRFYELFPEYKLKEVFSTHP